MLTPKQLKSRSFQMAGRNAYKAADVDAFLDEVYDSYDQMFRENGELVKKLNLVADKLQSYKADEDNIRNALLTAERMKESIVAEANDSVKSSIEDGKKKADEIVSEAESRADEILKVAQSNAAKLLAKAQEIYDDQVNSIKEEADREEAYLLNIKEQSAKVRADLMDSYQKQISILEFTPDFSEEVAAARAKKKAALEAAAEAQAAAVAEEFDKKEEPVESDEASDNADIDEYLAAEEPEEAEESEEAEKAEESEEEFEDIESGDDLFADVDDEEDEEDEDEEDDDDDDEDDEDEFEDIDDDDEDDISLF
ncbi:MAG: DivIVA domain-containing protein [Clostridiales bacterium]|nr:DivIVA domain-containing protein [Clostridiales bacterium]